MLKPQPKYVLKPEPDCTVPHLTCHDSNTLQCLNMFTYHLMFKNNDNCISTFEFNIHPAQCKYALVNNIMSTKH